TYISDISGKILTDLGDAHAATWSPDGKYILYMKDIDDGYRVTDSEIWIASLDGNHHWQLTDTPDKIELYPRWSLDGKYIIYHTESSNIYESELEIKE
ncbi:MAG: PD40 domain-containing protein, partial [Candidatus Marinimicrobia bacterium]|nr:PD40 domain-containing protein [Candidatus Neomarinimicrobiota bacterium]